MQCRYVGDIGDFGKYGLLRSIHKFMSERLGKPDFKLGVVWYLTENETHNNDGGLTYYLHPNQEEPTTENIARFAKCDKELYFKLRDIVRNNTRCVRSIRRNNVLPVNTFFYEATLSFNGIPNKLRLNERESWLNSALEKTNGCDIIFVDPDNGLEVKSRKPHHKYGPKYVFFNELAPYLERGQSLIIYQHMNRMSAEKHIKKRLNQLQTKLDCKNVIPLRYHRGNARVFFIIPSYCHLETILEWRDSFLTEPWGEYGHFTCSIELIDGRIIRNKR